MQIIGARQQINVSQQQVQYQARFDVQNAQQLLQRPSSPLQTQSTPTKPTPTPPQLATTLAAPTLPPAPTKSSESTPEDKEKEEDGKQFSALHTIGQVKKILEQLVSGKLLHWLDSANGTLPEQATTAAGAGHDAASTDPAATPAPPRDQVLVNYRYQQLSASFSGEVSLKDGSSVSWDFQFEQVESEFSFQMQRAADAKDPLMISLDGNYRATHTMVNFALNSDGSGRLDALSGAQFYLVHDKNGNGKVDDGSELFGPQTGQGFSELASLDDDGNGFIDSADKDYAALYAWQPGKALQTLDKVNVAALSTTSAETRFDYYQQNQLQARLQRSGVLITADKQVGLVQQVDFAV